MLTMLVEFFLVHATGFYTGFAAGLDWSRRNPWFGIAGLTSFYVLMIGAFAWAFEAWWMLLAFGWLFVGKLHWLLKKPSDDQTMHAMAAWAGMVVVYLFACFFTVFADIPYLGIRPELVAKFGLDPTSEGIGKRATPRSRLRCPVFRDIVIGQIGGAIYRGCMEETQCSWKWLGRARDKPLLCPRQVRFRIHTRRK